jgi:hypothetical protein
MDTITRLLFLEKRGWINRKPKGVYVFLLGFAYLLIWYFTFTFYIKYELKSLNIWIYALTLITIFTFIWAMIHLWILKKLAKKQPLPKYLDEK